METYQVLNNEIAQEYRDTNVINREKDEKAAKLYFLNYVNKKMRYYIDLKEKLEYLMDEGYYEKGFLYDYKFEEIKAVFKKAYAYNFRFPSFMSASKFYGTYALKSRDGEEILEKYEDRVSIIALYLAEGDVQRALNNVDAIMTAYQPATPTALNSGRKARGELVSCFKLTMDDTMNSIAENLGYCLELSRLGGGVGVNLTDLRPLGDPIKGILNKASGVMPVAKLLENVFSYSNQLGQRDGSGVAYLNIFHADVESFISSKKPNADEKIRLATLSTGLVIPGIFFELMKKGKDVVLFSPYDIYKEYGKRMSEINVSEMYYELLDNPNIRKIKRINARELYTEIKKAQFESGYPFEINDDNVNKVHALQGIGRVKMSNLCTEIFQVMETSVIADMDEPNEYGLDVSCNLGSIDIKKATEVEDFGKLIDTAMDMLTVVSDMTNITNVPSVSKANELMHSVGLGAMNMHSHLAYHGVLYGSEESIAFTDYFFEAMDYHTLKASVEVAKRKGETFYRFKESDYANGDYIVRKLATKEEQPKINRKTRELLGNIEPITSQMWIDLQTEIDKYGVFHAYRGAVAPTGSISYIRNCSPSIAPITERVEIRDYGDSRTFYPMPHINNENMNLFETAYDINPFRVIDLYAAATKHVDQGISMTLYVTDEWDTEKLAKVYAYAEHKGIKSVYYVRQRLQTIEECVACQI